MALLRSYPTYPDLLLHVLDTLASDSGGLGSSPAPCTADIHILLLLFRINVDKQEEGKEDFDFRIKLAKVFYCLLGRLSAPSESLSITLKAIFITIFEQISSKRKKKDETNETENETDAESSDLNSEGKLSSSLSFSSALKDILSIVFESLSESLHEKLLEESESTEIDYMKLAEDILLALFALDCPQSSACLALALEILATNCKSNQKSNEKV